MRVARLVVAVLAVIALVAAMPAPQDQDRIERSEKARELAKLKDESLVPWFENSVGYAVFPNVGKGGFGIGGAHGKGVLFVDQKPIGETELAQVTVGLQLGGQSFVEFIFFEDNIALENFKKGNFELSAQASAVAVTLGAAATADYEKGVAIFTMEKGGLMYEASVGGQKFDYRPWD